MTRSANPEIDEPPSLSSRTPSSVLMDSIKGVTAILTAFGALLAAFGTFTDTFSKWLPWLQRVPKSYMLVGAAILFLVTFLLQRNRFAQRSELRKPDALLLRRGEHLVGRQEDIDSISELIQTSDLVWLVGESGSGKSSLLQAGL